MKHLFSKTSTFIASNTFFNLTVALLVVSASWIALTGQYPMAFDEEFHFGLIKIYSHHLSPFLSAQPSDGDAYGAVARDPSFLYHYLMSFPFRLTKIITSNQAAQIIMLRFLNIALFASCLPLFRKVLIKSGSSQKLAHVCMAVFVLIPIAPLLAAQINYDNLLLPVTALLLYWTLNFDTRSRKEYSTIVPLLEIFTVGLVGCLIKFAFIPIFAAVILWLIISHRSLLFSGHWRLFEVNRLKYRKVITLIIIFTLMSVAAVNRYGINLVRYHDPIPECGKVLSLQHCQHYGPYIRDYNFAKNKMNLDKNPIHYTQIWLKAMWVRSFFAVDGPKSQHQTKGPFVIPAVAALVLLLGGMIAALSRRRGYDSQAKKSLSLFVGVALLYITAVWLQEYKAFTRTGVPVAINGRYLLPVILLLMLPAAQAMSHLLKRANFKIVFASLSLIALSWGGGGSTYILRSYDGWYWNNRITLTANHTYKSLIGPLTPGYHNPEAFLHYL